MSLYDELDLLDELGIEGQQLVLQRHHLYRTGQRDEFRRYDDDQVHVLLLPR